MPSLTNIRDAAVGEFKAACPGVTGVRSFSGELDLNTAKSLALGTGVTVLVAALEAESVPPLDRLDLAGTFAALVVVAGADGREAREAKALAVAESVTVNIHGSTFGLSGVGKARVAALIAAHVQGCFSRERALHEAIDTADSIEALTAIDINAGWPGQDEPGAAPDSVPVPEQAPGAA